MTRLIAPRNINPCAQGRLVGVHFNHSGARRHGPGESKHADIGISLPGTSEEPKAPVYVDGQLRVTLKGGAIVEEFIEILNEYVAQRYPAMVGTQG